MYHIRFVYCVVIFPTEIALLMLGQTTFVAGCAIDLLFSREIFSKSGTWKRLNSSPLSIRGNW